MENPMIYLDNAATTPMREEVIETMHSCMKDVYGNPSSIHQAGRKARVLVERARRIVSKKLNVSPSEIFFTSGGTEANNAILWGCYKDLGKKHFITSPLEHPAVLHSVESIARYHNAGVSLIDIDSKGNVDLEHLEFLLKENPGSVVSLMHANNEIGNLMPMNAVSKLCRQFDALFHSDMVQTMGKLHLDLQALDVDFAVASAHKFHGPKGAGLMFVRKGKSFRPWIMGGGQERNMRAGTENIYGIAGLAKALELAEDTMGMDQEHINNLRWMFLQLVKEKLPDVSFNGDAEGSALNTIVNLSLPEKINSEMLLPNLDIAGFCVSSGSACSSGSTTGSHVLTAMGVSDDRPSLRVSFSRFNTIEEVQNFVEVLRRLCHE